MHVTVPCHSTKNWRSCVVGYRPYPEPRADLTGVKTPRSEGSSMTEETMNSDMAVGLSLVFGVVAVVGAGWMFVEGGDEMAGVGFALAMLAATMSVVAVHLYWG